MRVRAFLALLAAALVIAVAIAAWPYTVDDAFIVGRYAQRLAHGLGYTMNDGAPTDGVTAPIALIPGVLATWLGLDAVLALKACGAIAAALAAGLIVWRASAQGIAIGAIALALCALRPTLGGWGAAGLETGLATLALAAVLEGGDRAKPMLILAAAAIPWLRPELVPSAVALVWMAPQHRRTGAIALSAGLIGAIAFRLILFGTPFPLSAAAKPPELANGIEYAGRALLIVFGAGVVPCALAWRDRAAIAVAVGSVAIMLAGGDWMPGFRLFAPLVPLYALASARVLAKWWKDGRRVPAIVCGLLLLGPAIDLAVEIPMWREAGRARESAGTPLADWLHGHATRVALVDVGWIAYRSGLPIVDLAGITDPEVGRLPGGHVAKPIDPGWLEQRAPDAIVLHSTREPDVDSQGRLQSLFGHPVERRVAEMGWVRARMRVVRVVRYSDRYWYVVLMPASSVSSRPAAFDGTLPRWRTTSPPGFSSPPRRSAIRTSCAAWSCWWSTAARDRSASSSTARRRSRSRRSRSS